MGGPWLVVLVVLIIVGIVLWTTGGRSTRDGGSTAGHYDPDAIGRYTLDPATMRYRYDLPTLPPSGAPPVPGSGPPHHRRRRRRRPDAGSG
jgi:hypothetical protein